MVKNKIEGMVAIQLTPFKKNGEVDEESYRRLVRYMLNNGVRAIITMGGISESLAMTEKQRKQVCEITVDEVKGKIPVIQGIIASYTNIALKLAKDAEEVGASGLMVPFIGSDEEMMYHHFNTVANAFPKIDVMLYDARHYSEIPVNVIKKLAKNCENVKYVKTQIGNTKVTRIINSLGDRIGVFCGTDTYLVPWLQLGCVGGTNSTPNVIPMHVRKIYEAALRKDWDAVNENWFKCWPVIYSFYGFGGGSRRTYKHALYWLGIFDNHDVLRDTGGKPSEEALQYTRKALEDLDMKLIR